MYVCKSVCEWKCHGPCVVIIAHPVKAASLFVPCRSCESNSACQAEGVISFHSGVILPSHVHAQKKKMNLSNQHLLPNGKNTNRLYLWSSIKSSYCLQFPMDLFLLFFTFAFLLEFNLLHNPNT